MNMQTNKLLTVRNILVALIIAFLNGWLYLLFIVVFHSEVLKNHYSIDDNLDLDALVSNHKLFSYTSTINDYLSHHKLDNYYTNEEVGTGNHPNVVNDVQLSTLENLITSWPITETSSDFWEQSIAYPAPSSSVSSLLQSRDQQNIINRNPHAIPRFNYQIKSQLKLAELYRSKEIPFILYNMPEFIQITDNVFSLKKLKSHFGQNIRIVEKSKSSYFLYYTVKNLIQTYLEFPHWKPPQTEVSMTFAQFVSELVTMEVKHNENPNKVGRMPYYYFTINAGEGWRTPWVRSAFPYYSTDRDSDSFFVVDKSEVKGINCRFGMKGTVSAAHYDAGRNFITMVRGRKRYILLPPSECSKLLLHPHGHPSSRHTIVNWSNVTQLRRHPKIGSALATETVLSRGEVLYLPSYWFHFIIAQDATIQCNARSGDSAWGQEHVRQCPTASLEEYSSESSNHEPGEAFSHKERSMSLNEQKRGDVSEHDMLRHQHRAGDGRTDGDLSRPRKKKRSARHDWVLTQ